MPPPDQQEEFVKSLSAAQTKLRALIHALLPDWHAAEDVLQETNGVLWRKADEFQVGTSFEAWSFRIAVNQVKLARLRFSREQQRLSDEVIEHLAAAAPDKLSNLEEKRAALHECYEQLAHEQRGLMQKRYSEDNSVDAIAQSLGRPVASIRQTLYRIRRSLASCIDRALTREARA